MPTYSHSKLSTYETCPLMYKLAYIDRVEREEEGVEAFMGLRFHEVMEKLYRDLKFKTYTLDELLEFYNQSWDKEYNDNIIIVKKDMKPADYRNIGKKCIEDYYKRYYPFDQGRVLGLEKKIRVDLNNDGRYKLEGVIDRICQTDDNTYEIHDYKTSGYLPEQKDIDEDRQLALYQIGITNVWNDVEKAKLIWHYVFFDKEMTSRRASEQLSILKQDIIRLIDEIENTREFPAIESSLCRWCAYPDLCPKRKHLYKVAGLPLNEYKKEPGVKLVQRYTELKKAKGELEEKIAAIEEEQAKIEEAAIEFAEKEDVSVIDGPSAQLKIDIKEELKAPTKAEDSTAWEELRSCLIKEGKYEEVSTVNTNMLNYRIRNKAWPDKFVEKIRKYLKTVVTKTVRLVKK